jgi:hypothetical protein
VKNFVDIGTHNAQYLVVSSVPMQVLGLRWQMLGPSYEPLQGKIVHGGDFMPAKKKAKKKKKH